MGKLTEFDRTYGPLIIGKTNWSAFRLMYSFVYDNGKFKNALDIHLGKLFIARLLLPCFLKSGKKEYGISFSDNFLQIFYGRQEDDHSLVGKSQRWSIFIPWREYRLVRHELYNKDNQLYWQDKTLHSDGESISNFRDFCQAKDTCDTVDFLLKDYDGTEIIAKTYLIFYKWECGTGRFKWLSFFLKDKYNIILDINFNREVGKNKGSWKSGLLGTSIEMIPDESRDKTMKRFCQIPLSSKNGKYQLEFIRRID